MRHLLDTLLRLRRGVAAPDFSGAPLDAAMLHPTAALLSHAWLAPHAAHLATMTARRTHEHTAPTPIAAHGGLR